jgi:putative transposase
MESLSPKNHAEEVAVFRHGLIGALAAGALDHGDLAAELRKAAERKVRPPGSPRTRTFSVPTLERWLYAYRCGGLAALAPRGRSDRGRGRDLPEELRELLREIRREHPTVSAVLIVKTLRNAGRISDDVSVCTVRRMLNEAGLARQASAERPGPTARLRWQAEAPGLLWHGDVCHGPTLTVGERRTPVRVHALLDDCSRFVVALVVASDEKEVTMLRLFTAALLEHGRPDALYLDNGATYRGDILQIACSRLGTALLHAKPHDAPARGKMERFWRTMRDQALDHVGSLTSLSDIEARLRRWVDEHYHKSPHAGLMGQTPLSVYAPSSRTFDRLDAAQLEAALTVITNRRVRTDSTLSLDGVDYEVPLGFLAGKVVRVATCFARGGKPELVLDDRRIALEPVDPTANARRKRPPRREPEVREPRKSTGFAKLLAGKKDDDG